MTSGVKQVREINAKYFLHFTNFPHKHKETAWKESQHAVLPI